MVISDGIVWALLIGRTDAAVSLRDQVSFIVDLAKKDCTTRPPFSEDPMKSEPILETGFNTKDRTESAETRHP
jgi:hypothetical protein